MATLMGGRDKRGDFLGRGIEGADEAGHGRAAAGPTIGVEAMKATRQATEGGLGNLTILAARLAALAGVLLSLVE